MPSLKKGVVLKSRKLAKRIWEIDQKHLDRIKKAVTFAARNESGGGIRDVKRSLKDWKQ